MVVVEVVAGTARRKIRITELESGSVILASLVDCHEASSAGEVVDDPLDHIAIAHELAGALQLLPGDLAVAQKVALRVVLHPELHVRHLDAIAAQYLS